jgi:hypothetical protein
MSENLDKTYAFIVDGDVFGTLYIPQNAPNYERLIAGLSSGPSIVDATGVDGVRFGWTFDGTNFVAPSE